MNSVSNGSHGGQLATIAPTELGVQREKFTFSDMQQLAKVAYHSQLFGKMTEPQIMMLMMISHAEGLHPVQALMIYDIVEGKPDVKPAAALARFQKAGGIVDWVTTNDQVCEAKFTHQHACPNGVTVKFTMDDARRAGLAGKNNWKGYPEDCLVAKVCKRGAKRALPGVLNGVYDPDDFREEEDSEPEAIDSPRSKLLEALEAKKTAKPIETTAKVIDVKAEVLREQQSVVNASEAPKKPESEVATWIREQLEGFNAELKGYDSAAKAVTIHQVYNAVVTAGLASGDMQDSQVLNDKGKRDGAMMAATMNTFWENDPGFIQDQVGAFLSQKIAEVIPKQATTAKQGSLLSDDISSLADDAD